jgi:hypothetical protein
VEAAAHIPKDPAVSLQLVERVGVAYKRKDWLALRALYDDRSLIRSVALGDEQVIGPSELITTFEDLENSVYEVTQGDAVAIDDDAVVVTGRVRHPLPSGGFGDDPHAWVLTFKNGLVWRSCAFRSHRDALLAYRRFGIDLGL